MKQNYFTSLPCELIPIIVWDAFLNIWGEISELVTVCKEWYSILTDINSINWPAFGDPYIIIHQTYSALKINKKLLTQFTVYKYLPAFGPDAVLESHQLLDYMHVFCASYNKKTWQYMRLPTTSDIADYIVINNTEQKYKIQKNRTRTYTDLLIKCLTPDAFFYLYQLGEGDASLLFLFVDVLSHITCSVLAGRFALKHINWFIKLLERISSRIIIHRTEEQWASIIQNIHMLRYPAARIRKFVDAINRYAPDLQECILGELIYTNGATKHYLECSRPNSRSSRDRQQKLNIELHYYMHKLNNK